VQAGWIPQDVSNTSQLVFPILANGCVDAGFEYIAPAYPNYPNYSGESVKGVCLIEVLMLMLPSLLAWLI
jgi:hypothetical protein